MLKKFERHLLEEDWTTIRDGLEVKACPAPDSDVEVFIFIVEDRTFIEAVEKKDASLVRSPYAGAVKTLAVCLAANESMDTGKPVKLS
jgi:hypothetical protein